MTFGLLPKLLDPPEAEWRRRYPNGLGASAFSSPAWQNLMRCLVGPECEPRVLVAETETARYSLPVFVRTWRYRRVEIVTQPIAYYVLPIECEIADAACVRPLAAASRAPFTSGFKWWLPPWLAGDWAPAARDVDTYLIEVDGPVDDFLKRKVRKRFLEYVRSSQRRGIEIVERPTPREVDEYFTLYETTFEERSWVGDKFPIEFFHGVATELGDGGRLVLLRHEGRVVGGGVVLFDRYAVHYFQGATERDNPHVKPHMVLYDWLVRTASARGLRYVNLGGTNDGNESLVQFKQGWGAEPRPVPHVSWALDRRTLGALGFSWLRGSLGVRSDQRVGA